MDNQLVPQARSSSVMPMAATGRLPRRIVRTLEGVEGNTLVRTALVRGEALVAKEKLDEIDYLAWKAMSGHAMLDGWANHLAGENPVLMDELRFFKDMARLGKGEVIADTIDKFRRI